MTTAASPTGEAEKRFIGPSAEARLPKTRAAGDARGVRRWEIRMALGSYLKLAGVLMAGYTLYLLWPLLLLVFLALFLAVTLEAFVDWFCSRGLNRRVSLAMVIGGLWLALAGGLALLIPALMNQAAVFSHNLPRVIEEALDGLPMGEVLRTQLERAINPANWSESQSWFGHLMSAGGSALGGISEVVLVLVIAMYLLINGSQAYEWLLAFFSPLHRSKLRTSAEEISKMIFGYVAGQAVTSALVMIYSFVVLSLLHVPGALTLAVLAGVLDILPILGFIISTAPACLLALSVSPKTAAIVLLLYVLFHLFENYLIVPKVYGKSLRLSTLTVLLGLLAGGLLAGIPGMLAALPVIASYAAIERIWLKPFLRGGVAEKHEIQKIEHFGAVA